MKKDKIDFNVALIDAYGEVMKEDKSEKQMIAGRIIVNILSNPQALPENKTLDGEAIVKRLMLQQKVASKEPQIYSTDELSVIREAVVNLYNKKLIPVEFAGGILKMTE